MYLPAAIPFRDTASYENADLGIAFDGDFDRCFFFDHSGEFISGEYVAGLLSKVFFAQKILFDQI